MSKDKTALKIIKKISSQEIFSCKWYRISHDKILFPNGKKGNYYLVNKKGSVIIIPVTSDNKIILTKQYRYTSKKFSIELPAGGFDYENPKIQAQNELEQEAGFKAKRMKKIGVFFPYNGISSEICYVYLATQLTKTSQKLDDTEFIEVMIKPIKEVYKMAEKNKITDGMTMAALFFSQKIFKKII